MEDISYFFNILEKSDISLLGYSFKEERIKDELISKIPHLEIKEIGPSFSFKSYLRNEKLNHLFDGNLTSLNVKWFVLDLNDIRASSNDLGTRQNRIRDIIEKIREDMYSGTYPDKSFYKLLMLSPMYRSSSDFDINNFTGGSTPLYMSDFVSIIKDGSLEVIKNRFEHNEKKISLDNIKDYTYICSYENCQ
jgi:hypothetical protein